MDQQVKEKPRAPLIQPPPEAEAFYSEVLQLMAKSGIPFLVSGTYALASYTGIDRPTKDVDVFAKRSEEHTSELQSQFHLVCRLLLEKKKQSPLQHRRSI